MWEIFSIDIIILDPYAVEARPKSVDPLLVTVISDSVIPNSLGSYMRIRYIRFQFWVITVSVISDSVILVSIISDSYLVISDSL